MDSLDQAFKRNRAGKPTSFLKETSTSTVERDLVAEREAAEKRARLESAKRTLVDEVRDLRARQAFIDCLPDAPPPRVVPREKSGTREMTAVVLASDWHVEEVVTAESVAGRNRYDLDVASDRVERFFQAVAWHVEHQRASGKIAVRDMILWLGGDLMTGYIHEELVESNELSPTETILWLMPRLEGGIRMLLDRLDLASLVIPCSFGNHGRTTVKKRVSTAYANSFEWLMYHQIAQRFKDDKRVRFEVTNSAHQYVDAYDFHLHFHHGDELNYQGGVGGLGIPFLKAIPAWDLVRRSDYHFIGHWHQLLDFGRGVVNGSLIGYGPYSLKIRAPFEPPQQVLTYVDSKRGKTMTTHLWVAEREEASK